jgi:hypothetical protein
MKSETAFWGTRAVADAVELDERPPAMPPDQAQPWCNFVVWTPERLPAGCQLSTGTIRREAPPGRVEGVTAGRTPWSDANPVAYRYEITGPDRRLRVKQFLYDWAFPALDHPCLWESHTRPVRLGDHVLWYGVDYMKHQAASARLARTTIELSVLEGSFEDAEILYLYEAMRPAAPDAVEAIGRTPFARLSYWARYPNAPMVHVPIGLWKFRRTGSAYTGRWTAEAPELKGLLAGYSLPSELIGLEADSAARFTDADGRTEVEVVYSGGPWRGHELRLIAQRPGAGHLSFPAEPAPHPHHHAEVEIGRIADASLAWIDEDYGPWDAAWQDPKGNLEAKLLASTSPSLSRERFLEAAGEVVAAAHAGERL